MDTRTRLIKKQLALNRKDTLLIKLKHAILFNMTDDTCAEIVEKYTKIATSKEEILSKSALKNLFTVMAHGNVYYERVLIKEIIELNFSEDRELFFSFVEMKSKSHLTIYFSQKLKKELKQIKEQMTKLAINIHKLREEYAKVLGININKSQINIDSCNILIEIEREVLELN